MISNELKQEIVKEVKENGLHYQEVAHKYGIFMLRVEAICKLHDIETQWKQEVSLFPLHDETEKKIRLVFKTHPWLEMLVSEKNSFYWFIY